MPDLPEDSWDNRNFVTHQDLMDESATLMRHMAKMAETMRDQLNYLNKTHTVALMAAELYGKVTEGYPENVAKNMYREVQQLLEIDNDITGSIPPAA